MPATTALLFEYRDAKTGMRRYATESGDDTKALMRTDTPLCRVWRSPLDAPTGDFGAVPVLEGQK